MVRNPGFTLAIALGIGAGVAGVLAMHVVGSQVVERASEPHADGADLLALRKPSLSEADYFELRRTWRNGSYPFIAGLTPVIEGVVEFEGRMVRLLGFDPTADLQSPMKAIQGADSYEFINTKSVILRTERQIHTNTLAEARIIRVIPGLSELFLADLPTAQELLARPDELDAIWAREHSGTSLNWLSTLFPGLEAATPIASSGTVQVGEYSVSPMVNWLPLRSMTTGIAFNVGVLGIFVILMSGFLVYQAMSVNIAKRSNESERLFGFGVKRSAIRGLFVFDSLMIGLFGSAIGVVAGALLLELVPGLDKNASLALTDSVAIPKALTIGILVSLLAGSLAVSHKRSTNPYALPIVLITIAILLAIVGVQQQTGLSGAYLLLMALCLLHFGAVVPATIRLAQWSSGLFYSGHILFRLNLRTAASTGSEMRMSLSALSFAVATTASVGLMVESFRLDVLELLDDRIAPGLHLRDTADVDFAQVKKIQGIAKVQTYFRGNASIGSHPIRVIATDLDSQEAAMYEGTNLSPGEVLINQLGVRKLGLEVGDAIAIDGLQRPVSARIGAVFRDFGVPLIRVIAPLDLTGAHGLVPDRARVEGNPRGIAEAKRLLQDRYPKVTVRTGEEVRKLALGIFDRTFAATHAMILVAVVISAMGLFSGLFATQARRLSELRVLYTLGVSRSQMILLSASQASAVGILAVLAAIPLSYAMALVLCEVVNIRAFGWTVQFRWLGQTTATFVFAGLLAVVVASTLLAFRLTNAVRLTGNAKIAGQES